MTRGTPLDLILVGRGAAGTALAHALARGGWRGRLGWFGNPHTVAFHQARPEHRLNTRAHTMGIDADDTGDFLAWAAQTGLGYAPDDFPHRRSFGAYLDARARDAIARLSAAGASVVIEADTALRAEPDANGVCVRGANGAWHAPIVVAALGYGTARASLHPGVFDPWTAPYHQWAGDNARVAIIGAGLSGLDAIQSVREAGHRGPLMVFARRTGGPLAHADHTSPLPGLQATAWATPSLLAAIQALRDAARTNDWRDVLNAARPAMPDWWQSVPAARRAAALQPARLDLWSTLRHRAAPDMLASLRAAEADGALQWRAALVQAVDRKGAQFELQTSGGLETADAVIDARGPSVDVATAPFFSALLDANIVRRSATGVGLASAPDGLLGAHAGSAIYGIGAVHFGERLETTAFHELRGQAAALAAQLC